MNLNRVQLAGRLTRDPELKYTQAGTAIADFGLAVSRFWKNDAGENQEQTDFIDLTAFGARAETIGKHLHKGSAVYIEGRLHLEQWDDKQTGQKRSKLKVVAESMQFVGPKPQGQPPVDEPTPSPALQEQRARRAAATPPPPAKATRDLDMAPDDIPFRSSIHKDVRGSRLNRLVF